MKAVFFHGTGCRKTYDCPKEQENHQYCFYAGSCCRKQVLPYIVAKGGVLQMTKALALEWAKYNIQVNAICPGYVITDINKEALSEEKDL